MDSHNKLATSDSELGKRLTKITANFPELEGVKLNFGIYEVVDVNAFACGDGKMCIRDRPNIQLYPAVFSLIRPKKL